MTATISITDKGKTITYHAHHMRDVIEPVKQYGMFGEQLNAKKKLHTLTFYTEDYFTMRGSLAAQYGEYVSIMGVYSTFEQADHRWDELDREGFDVFPIDEFIVDANYWEYIGGYAE